MKNIWKNFWDKYMTSAAEKAETTVFPADEIRRYQIIFTGLVQGVGFRYETWTLAQKLGLTGFVENLPNGTVYAEIQGQKNKIIYLIDSLKNVPRIHIYETEINECELIEEAELVSKN